MRSVWPVAAAAYLAGAGGCSRPALCLAGDDGCERAPLCERLDYTCDGGRATIEVIDRASSSVDLIGAEGRPGDYLLTNGRVTVVIDALGAAHGLAPTGGTVLDLGESGGHDHINNVYQLAGVLPDDAFAYHTATIVDRSPELVSLIVRGSLDGRPDVEIVTRYELRRCDPGLRIRSELYNGSPDQQVFIVADLAHWGKRDALPFAPIAGQGFWQPELDLLDLADLYRSFPYLMARPARDEGTSYGFVRCDASDLYGVNDPEISAVGTDFGIVRPGQHLALERFLIAGEGPDLGRGVARVVEARRMLHGERESTDVSGRLVTDGMPFAGSSRRAVVLISEIVGSDLRRPLTTVVPDDAGVFSARVPGQGWLSYQVWSFGRPVVSGVVPRGSDVDLGDIDIEPPGRLSLSVSGSGELIYATAALHPVDREVRARVEGSWFGRMDRCAPWLGSPVSGSPACNRVLVEPPGVDVEVPAGAYELWVSAGPSFNLAMERVDIGAGEIAQVDVELKPLDLVPAGWLSADLHVHGKASFDSSLPDRDRVQTFVASGVQVIAASDHDFVRDYAETIDELGVDDRVRVIPGVESTGLIPFLDVPGDDFPRTIGHFNHWPMAIDPAAPRGGAPWDELVEPGQLFDELAPLLGDRGVHMLNHPWDEPLNGRDLGYLRAIQFDPRLPIPALADGSNNGMLVAAPTGMSRNLDFHLIEVQNGAVASEVIKTRPLWFSLLSQGHVRTGVANSDSHSLVDAQLGFGRSWVQTGGELGDFDVDSFNAALRDGRVMAGNGVVVLVTIGSPDGPRRGLGLEPYVPEAGDTIAIEVRAPPWIPVDEVRLITSQGQTVIASGADLDHPADPLGDQGIVRWSAQLPVDDLVGAEDDWLLVEAGMAFFASADLDDDGVPDTTDNNGDGVVDVGDIEDEDDDSGPFEDPDDPEERSDPRYPMTRILSGGWPYGLANPILIDVDGDGWNAPGLRGQP